MTLTFTYTDGKTVVCEVDNDSTVAVDSPARGAGGSLVLGRVPTSIVVREVRTTQPTTLYRTLASVAVA